MRRRLRLDHATICAFSQLSGACDGVVWRWRAALLGERSRDASLPQRTANNPSLSFAH